MKYKAKINYKIIYILIFLVSLNINSQELFDYEFDENITIKVIENSDIGELENGQFIQGSYKNQTVIYIREKKDMFSKIPENKFSYFFKGARDRIIKSDKGKLISEKYLKINDVSVCNYQYSCKMNKEKMIVENYLFIYKSNLYKIIFLNKKEEFNLNKDLRTEILDSIKMN